MIKLKRLELLNYKIHKNSVFTFDDFTEIRKPNEFGKSTIIEAIQDAFYLLPERLKDKKTRGSDREPVILVDLCVDGKEYRLSVNSQSESISLRGEGVYLESRDSILRFFRKHGYPFFSYLVRDLFVLRERDLDIDTRSRDFRKFTEDIFNVENINALKNTIDRILKEKEGFRDSSFGKELTMLIDDYNALRLEVRSLDKRYREKVEKINELNQESKRLESIEKELKLLQEKVNNLQILGNEIKKKEIEKELAQYKEQKERLTERLKKVREDIKTFREKEKRLEASLNEKRQKLNKTLEAERRLRELDALIKDIKDKQEEIRSRKNRLLELETQISKDEENVRVLEDKVKSLESEREDILRKIQNIKGEGIEVTDELLVEIEKKYNEVLRTLNEVNAIRNKISLLKKEVKPYNKYTINDLKEAIVKWSTYDKLKETGRGVVEVLSGQARFNGVELEEGAKIEFLGKLRIDHNELSAVVYTTIELSALEQSLHPFFNSFANLDGLRRILKVFEEISDAEKKLRVMNPEGLEKKKQELEKRINEVKSQIETSRKQKETMRKLEEKKNEVEKHLREKKEYLIKLKTVIEGKKKEKEKLSEWLSKVQENELVSLLRDYGKEKSDKVNLVSNKKAIEDDVKTLETELSTLKEDIFHLIKEEGSRVAELESVENKIKILTGELAKLREYEELIDELPFGFVKEYITKSYEEIERAIELTRAEIQNKMQEKIDVSQKVAVLKGYLENASFVNELENKRTKLLELERKIETYRKMEAFLRKVKDVLGVLGEKIEKQYAVEIEKRTYEIFSKITGESYKWAGIETGTVFLENFGRKWAVKRKDGIKFGFEELSDGTKTQLLFSIRLALISLFLGDRKAFLLLDEPFAYYDKQREKAGMDILQRLSREGWQIILMTARV